jgi:hypothetical protein
VRFIKETIDTWPYDEMTGEPAGSILTPQRWWDQLPTPGIWQRLATRAGGEVVNADDW